MSEPWTTEPRDAGADSLFHRFVCRVSGAPVDTVDGLRSERGATLASRLAAAEAALRADRERVSDLLFSAIGSATEKPVRNRLIALKRELYNLRLPGEAKVEGALAGVDPETAGAVRAFVETLREAATLEAELREAHDGTLGEARERFRDLVRDDDFRKGLMVSSRALYGNLERYRRAVREGMSGRDEKAERGLLRYYTRMAAKATPFATFCAIIPGTFVEGEEDGGREGETVFSSDPKRKRSFVRINKFLYGLLSDHLRTRPAVRHALRVERNPTLRQEGERLVYLTSVDGREVFQRLGDNEVLQLIASRFVSGGEPTHGELIAALSGDPEIDATPEEAEAYLDKLLEIGFLRFRTGIREQDADWDLPFRAFLDGVDDDHARRVSELLGLLRDGIERYTAAGVEERADVIERIDAAIEEALSAMEVKSRLRRDMAFYEDATSEAEASIALTPGVRRAFGAFETWVRTTARLAWPRHEQAGMRHFYEDYYGDREGVPLLQFYEDFYREHFKSHVEKETRQRNGARAEELDGYDVMNPFGLDFIRSLSTARQRLSEAIRLRWERDVDAPVVDITREELEAALRDVEPKVDGPRSMGAFALLVPSASEGEDPQVVVQGGSYTAGYGKYFSRFLYMLPDDVQEAVRVGNNALTSEALVAEICGDAQFNANLHPPLLRWEISYPTGESGATEEQLRSSEIRVERDPDDVGALRLMHVPTGRQVLPVDLGFLNPRMRPPLYQLLSRFTPPVMWAPTIPETPAPPPAPKPAEAVAAAVENAAPPPAGAEGGDAPVPAPAPAPPPERVHYRPRVTFEGRLVLSRRRWLIPASLVPQRRPDESAADFFVRVARWRGEHGIPETGYLRLIPIPAPRPQGAGEAAKEEAAPPVEAEIPGYDAAAPGMAGAVEADPEADTDTDGDGATDEKGAAGAVAEGGAEQVRKRTQPSRDFYKPQYMDFSSPLMVALLGRLATGIAHFQVVVEERLPDREGLARHEGAAFATELVLQLNFPRGAVGEAAEPASLATAAPGEA